MAISTRKQSNVASQKQRSWPPQICYNIGAPGGKGLLVLLGVHTRMFIVGSHLSGMKGAKNAKTLSSTSTRSPRHLLPTRRRPQRGETLVKKPGVTYDSQEDG